MEKEKRQIEVSYHCINEKISNFLMWKRPVIKTVGKEYSISIFQIQF